MTAQITLPPVAPSRADRNTFATRADAWVAWEENNLVPEMNTALVEINNNATIAQMGADVGQIAIASANFKGEWSILTGGLTVPASVFHNGAFWMLLSDVADVTTKVPGIATEWEAMQTVSQLPWFTASGAIAQGGTAAINSDGTVSAPVYSAATTGADSMLASGTKNPSICTTSSGKIFTAYSTDPHGVMKFSAGTIASSGAITFGAETSSGVTLTGDYYCLPATNDKVIVFAEVASRIYAVVASINVSTLEVTIGSGVYVTPSPSSQILGFAFDAANDKVLLTCQSTDAAPQYRAYVGTISGTAISFGTAVDTAMSKAMPVCVGSNKFVLFGNNTTGTVHSWMIGTVSGTAVAFGSKTATGMGTASQIAIAHYPETNQIIFATNGSSLAKFGLATFTGGSVRVVQVFVGSVTDNLDVAGRYYGCIDYYTKRFVLYLNDTSTGYGKVIEFDLDKYGYLRVLAETTVNSYVSARGIIAYSDIVKKTLIGYWPNQGRIKTFRGAFSTARNFIGFAQTAVTTGEVVQVSCTQFVDENQTALVAGEKYYVADNGALTATETDVFAGTAVGSTRLLVKG